MDNYSPSSAKSQATSPLQDKTPDPHWVKIKSVLSRELSDQSFKTWFEPVLCNYLDDQLIKLEVPDQYYGNWLKSHYHEIIASACEEVVGKRLSIEFVSAPKPNKKEPLPAKPPFQDISKHGGEIIGPNLNSRYTFEDFVIGPGNRFAHAAAMAVCEAPARQYNPLFIYGPVGLGKTHLMQSIAHEIKRRNPGFKFLYIPSEKFTNQLITAIQTRSTTQFRNKFRTVDLLLIDDIHFIAEKEATQEEFFHTFNTLYDAHKQIVVSSDRPPKEIPGLEERLVSRFGWGLVTDIQPPDFETRVAILKKKMEKETVHVPDDVLYFIASKIRSNIRELEGALIRVVAYGTLTGQIVDLKLAQEMLRDSLKEEEQKVGMEQIQRTVADFFHLKVSDLRAKRRSRSVARPRQIAMFLIRNLTSHSLPEIGEYFGGRDHTTVLHAVNKINSESETSSETRRVLEQIRNLLKKGS
ncbi:MAG: chromosomal replication initiator protein DnaA [Candidatus Omnitrophica bacterium]|nr:chromosomal replication initiator protein DnaA [Candidatus Omnitrophota bacterium]